MSASTWHPQRAEAAARPALPRQTTPVGLDESETTDSFSASRQVAATHREKEGFMTRSVVRARPGLLAFYLLSATLIARPAAGQPAPIMVADLTPGAGDSSIREIVDANGVAVFNLQNQLYRSDGTAAGTVLIGPAYSAQELTNLNGLVLFAGYDPAVGEELFRTDGTAAGTSLVIDAAPGGTYASPRELTRVGNHVYFVVGDAIRGVPFAVWVSDGTAAGSRPIKTFSLAEGEPKNLIAVGGGLYFETFVSNQSVILWYQATAASTPQQMRTFVDAGSAIVGIGGRMRTGIGRTMAPLGSLLVFMHYTQANGYALWKSDGTPQGTQLVSDPFTNPGSDFPSNFTAVGGLVVFGNGFDLWSTDGTAAGTALISSSTGGYDFSAPLLVNGLDVLFWVTTLAEGPVLYRVRPPSAAATRLMPLMPFPGFGTGPGSATAGTFTYFAAGASGTGVEPWVSDTTLNGTRLLGDIWPGIGFSQPGDFTAVGGAVFFTANDGVNGRELWVAGLPSRSPTPTSADDFYSITAGSTLNIPAPGVLANDASNGGGALTTQLVTGPAVGTFTLNTNGSFSYAPSGTGPAVVTFTYRAINAQGAGAPARVTISVSAQGAPTSTSDSYATSYNSPLIVQAPGVLANDNAPNATVAVVNGVSSGSLLLNPNGGFTYTPQTGFSGNAQFTYRATNAGGPGNVATVSIAVGTPGAPTAADDAYSTIAGITLNLSSPGVLGNDSSPGGAALTAQIVSPTSNGGVSLSGNGSFTYTPNPGFTGTDAFTYRVSNGSALSNVASVTITVAAAPTVAQPPVGLFAHTVAGNVITLRWTPPATGPAPTSYVMEGGAAPGQTLAAIPTGSATPVFTFAAPNGAFYLRVRTIAGAQTSAASNEIRVFVNQPAAPSAPAGLTGMVNGQQVALSWRNTFGGGTPASVVLDVTGALATSLPLGLVDTFTFPNVPVGTYTFSVRAVNTAGSSVASNPVTLTFPGVCSGTPAPPVGFLAYNLGNTLNLMWEPPASGPAATSYVLNVAGAFNGALPFATRGLSTPVPPGSYTFSVSAMNACGASAPTTTQTVVVP